MIIWWDLAGPFAPFGLRESLFEAELCNLWSGPKRVHVISPDATLYQVRCQGAAPYWPCTPPEESRRSSYRLPSEELRVHNPQRVSMLEKPVSGNRKNFTRFSILLGCFSCSSFRADTAFCCCLRASLAVACSLRSLSAVVYRTGRSHPSKSLSLQTGHPSCVLTWTDSSWQNDHLFDYLEILLLCNLGAFS